MNRHVDEDPQSLPQAPLAPRTRRALLLAATGAAALSVPLLGGTGAGPAGARTQTGDTAAIAKRLRKRRMSDDTIDAAVEALALVGVGTYDDPTATDPLVPVTGPASPLRFLRWQVVQMAHEVATRNGVTGAELDGLFEPPAGAPPPALLLAAYAREAATPGAKLVRGVLGKRTWSAFDAIVFPGLLQAVFVGELTQASAAASTAGTTRRSFFLLAPRRPVLDETGANAAGVCSTVSSWVDDVLNGVANALKVDTSGGGVSGFLGTLWNGVVDLGKGIVKGLIEHLTAPVVAIVKSIATAVAVASQVLSLIKPWNVVLETDPTSTRFGVGAERVTGALTVAIDTGFGGDWPPTVTDCAATAGLKLPSLTGAGSPVTWTVTEAPIDLIAVEEQADALDAGGRAKVSYVTDQEDPETAKGDPHQGTVTVKVSIKRDDLTELKSALSNALFSTLPDFVVKVLQPTLGPTIASLLDKIVALAPADATGSLAVTYHEKKEPTVTPEEGEPGGGEASGCPYGTWSVGNLAAISESLVENATGSDAIDFIYTDDGGSSTVEFRGDGTFTWSFDQYQVSGTADVPDTGVLLVTMLLDGTAEGTFKVEDGTLVLGDIADGLSLTGENYLNGSDLGPVGDLSTSFWLQPGGSLALTCGDDHMTLTPLWMDVDAGYELTRA